MTDRAAASFTRVGTALVLITAAGLAALVKAQSDTWWNLRAGRQIWETGKAPLTETWSWTAYGREWPDHEWLWQASAYALQHVGGMPLLAAVNAALAIGALGLALRATPQGDRDQGMVGLGLLILVTAFVSPQWSLRPQVASLFLFALLVLLLVRERFVWTVPVMLLWANLHGAVATGGVVLVMATITAAALWFRARDEGTRRRAITLGAVTMLGALATLATPLGTGLWHYVLSSPRTSKTNNIAEWQSAFHLGPVQVVFWLWVVGFLAVVVRRRAKLVAWPALVLVVISLAMAALSVLAVRNTGFFMLATLPALRFLLAPTLPTVSVFAFSRTVLAAWTVIVAAFAGASWWRGQDALEWHPFSEAVQRAVESCPTPVYNTYDAGGGLLWFTPEVKVFIDSRQDPYPAGLFDLAYEVEGNGDPEAIAAAGWDPVHCAVVPADSAAEQGFLDRGWRADVADGSWVVLVDPQRTSS